MADHHSHTAEVRQLRPEGRTYLLLTHPQGPPCSEEQDLSSISDRSCTFWAQHDQAFRLPSIERLGSAHDALRFSSVELPADLALDASPFGNLPPTRSHRPRKRTFSREALILSASDPRPLPSSRDRCAFRAEPATRSDRPQPTSLNEHFPRSLLL